MYFINDFLLKKNYFRLVKIEEDALRQNRIGPLAALYANSAVVLQCNDADQVIQLILI